MELPVCNKHNRCSLVEDHLKEYELKLTDRIKWLETKTPFAVMSP